MWDFLVPGCILVGSIYVLVVCWTDADTRQIEAKTKALETINHTIELINASSDSKEDKEKAFEALNKAFGKGK